MARAADRFAEEGKYKKIEAIFLSNGFLFDLTFAVIAFVAFLFGDMSWLSRVVYALVGLCGLYMLAFYRHCGRDI